MYSLIFREHVTPISKFLRNLSLSHSSRGGPRCYPYGFTRYGFLKLHRKRAEYKEIKYLIHKKHLYGALFAAHIGEHSESLKSFDNTSDYGPVRGKEEVKALSDRFKTSVAEDLWNAEDGRLESPPPSSVKPSESNNAVPSIIDFGNIVMNPRNLTTPIHETEDFLNGIYCLRPRHYSKRVQKIFRGYKFRREDSSDSDPGDEKDWSPVVEPEITTRPWTMNDGSKTQSGTPNYRNVEKLLTRSSDRNRFKPLKRNVRGDDFDAECNYQWAPKHIREQLKERLLEKEMANVIDRDEDDDVHEKEEENGGERENSGFHVEGKRFDECAISSHTLKALTMAGRVRMAMEQEATLSIFLQGKDALIKANNTKCGNCGAFLVPAIEAVQKALSRRKSNINPPSLVTRIFAVILCPTGDRAFQIAEEAKTLLKYHAPIGVQTLIGGTRFSLDVPRLDETQTKILIANPARLLEHMVNRSGLSSRLKHLKMFIIDEIDDLVEFGYRKDVIEINKSFPKQRQSLVFSASGSKEIRRLCQLVLKKEHAFIDTAKAGSGWSQVQVIDKVKQRYLIAPHENHFLVVYHILKEHMSRVPDFRAIVFCSTDSVASLMSQLFRGMNMNVMELHSRLPPFTNKTTANEFSNSKGIVLVACDVTVELKDFRDVSLVIQVGIPCDRKQYVRRIAWEIPRDTDEECALLLAPFEAHFLRFIKDLPVLEIPSPNLDESAREQVERLLGSLDYSDKENAYKSYLRYYRMHRGFRKDKGMIATLANEFRTSMGLLEPPS